MADKKQKQSDTPIKETQAPKKADSLAKDVQAKASPPQKAPPKKEVVTRKEPLVTFDRWFRSKSKTSGFKAHWAAGMKAYTDTSVKRTMSDWDKVFATY